MATLHIPSGGLPLVGWPAEPYRYSRKESTIKRSAVVLKVNKQIIQDLQECAKSGKAVRLQGGRVPRIQYGQKSIDLRVEPEKFTHELYTSTSSHDSLQYIASITQRAAYIPSTTVPSADTAGVDDALAALKQNLASHAQDKQANQTLISSSVFADPQIAKRNRILSERFVPKGGSQHHSPSLGATRPTHAPTSVPLSEHTKMEKMKALAPAVTHFLASDPKDEQTLHKVTKIPTADLLSFLQKHAELDTLTRKWKLKDRSYKDLDIWKFDWRGKSDMRDRAIDNAVRAFDRLRLGKDDKHWQMLLPQHERGKGKLLSRLHGNNNQSGNHLTVNKERKSPPGASSPLAPVSDTEGKAAGRLTPKPSSTPMSRTASAPGKAMSIEKRLKESQKARAAEEAKEAKRKEKETKATTTQSTAAAKGPKPTTVAKKPAPSKFKSDEIVHSSDDESDGDAKGAHIIKARAQPALKDARSPLSTSSSDGKPLKDSSLVKDAKNSALKPTAPKQAVSPNTAIKRDSPQKTAASKGAATPLPPADAKAKAEARRETPVGRVEKRSGGDKPATKPQLSPRKDATTKPKVPSPLGRTAMASTAPSIFGNHERSPSVMKKSTTSARVEQPKKRPAPADDSDRDRPRKAVKPNPSPLPSKVSSAKPSIEHKPALKNAPKASPTPAPSASLKRKAAPSPPPYAKHRRTESSATSASNSSTSRTTTARTSISSQSPPTHIPLALSQPAQNGGYSPSTSTASSSSDPLGGKYGWEKALEEAERFRKVLYPKYVKLHAQVVAKGESASKEEVGRVWRLHLRLKDLKEEIRRGSLGA